MSKDHAIFDPPPSYNEAVLGVPAASNGFAPSSPLAHEVYSHHAPSPAPAPAPALPPVPYNVYNASFPPGLGPLVSGQMFTVGSKFGPYKYKIKDMAGLYSFTAKGSVEGDICNCCDPTARWMEYNIRDLNKVPLVQFKAVVDELGCFTFPRMHLEVSFVPDIPIGQVVVRGRYMYDVANIGGDVLLTVEGEVGCCEILPYKICTPGGSQIGTIERVERVKNRVIFPMDMDIRCKALLLATTVFIQHMDEQRRKN
ncbi:uncharacterized protein LOC122246155 isoform X2 [Penaeus japonicus]|uniref:uncharacterized protein LOC122246155 isoform X2 n=1 Tax=Penaeus japonicus TaxID=27405 RepID=UPI001C7112A2|nr:uncharacterized protein LOC122246155 isoform X2 [Penaeus japonicus]